MVDVLSSSIRGFVTHVEVAGQSPRQDDSEAITRMQEVYRPLLDKIMKKSDDSGKKIAYLLSDWLLLEYPYRHLMAHSLSLDFGPQADKRLKLASILAIEHSFNTYTKNGASPNRHSAVSKSGEITADQLSDLDQTGVVEGCTICTEYIKKESIANALLLDMTATSIPIFRDIDVITEWSTHLANVVLHDGTVSADGHRTMTRLTGLALGLYMSFSKLLAAQALEEVKMASTEPKQPTLVVDTDTTGNSVHTGPKPLGWGFVLCMIDMYRVVKDMQEVSERIPVGNKCAAVIRDFTLPLMSDVNIAQIWSLISPVLDRPVELDYSTLVVIAQYVITRPTILIPEIFRYLTTPEVRTTSEQDRAVAVKNRNLLGVASALGDLDFFNLPMDQKADSDRSIARGGEAVSTDDRRELLKNPSQLMSVFKRTSPRALSSSKSSVSEEQLLAVLKRMGGAIPPPVWPSVIHVILSKLEGSPSDLTLVRIWTLLASSIVTSREAIAASYRSISMMLERQGDVTEAMLEAAMEVSDEGLDDLRMSRVLPFKILKTFDVLKKSGHDTSLYESIRPLLKS
ncbi:hypothetical protein BG004_004681, partial [Podila humilis]